MDATTTTALSLIVAILTILANIFWTAERLKAKDAVIDSLKQQLDLVKEREVTRLAERFRVLQRELEEWNRTLEQQRDEAVGRLAEHDAARQVAEERADEAVAVTEQLRKELDELRKLTELPSAGLYERLQGVESGLLTIRERWKASHEEGELNRIWWDSVETSFIVRFNGTEWVIEYSKTFRIGSSTISESPQYMSSYATQSEALAAARKLALDNTPSRLVHFKLPDGSVVAEEAFPREERF